MTHVPALRFRESAGALQSASINRKRWYSTPLIKQLTEAALSAELTLIWLRMEANRKNGLLAKTIKAPTGTFELATPRDRVMAL